MRLAHQVWIGVFCLTFLIIVVAQQSGQGNSPTSTTASSSATSAAAATTQPEAAATAPPAPALAAAPAPAVAESVSVTRVIDGDTLVVDGDRRVRILGIDACEMSTPGGKRAQEYLQSTIDNPLNSPITLTREPGVDRDRFGRELRYVQLAGTDLGELMVLYPEVGVYAGRNDAAPAYVAALRSQDSGPRTCGGLPDPPASNSDVDVDLDHHDRNHRDGSATLGFCRHKWWC